MTDRAPIADRPREVWITGLGLVTARGIGRAAQDAVRHREQHAPVLVELARVGHGVASLREPTPTA